MTKPNTTKKKIPSAEVVGGVRLDKVNLEVLNKQIEVYGGKPATTAKDAVNAFSAAMKKLNLPDQFLADCRTCGGVSDGRLDACPICGDGGLEAEDGQAVPPIVVVGAVMEDRSVLPTRAATPNTDRSSIAPSKASLDDAVAHVRDLQRQAVVSLWELGMALSEISDKRLHTQRVDEKGVPRYKAWGQFCLQELGMTGQHANSLIDTAKLFDAETIATVGVAKLSLIGRLDPAERESLLKKAKDGLPLSKVAQEVRQLASGKQRTTGRRPNGPGGKRRLRDGEVMATLVLSSTKIPLLRVDGQRAQSIDDLPSAEQLVSSGRVVFSYRVERDAKGNLELTWDRRRADDEPAQKPDGPKREPKKARRKKRKGTQQAEAAQ